MEVGRFDLAVQQKWLLADRNRDGESVCTARLPLGSIDPAALQSALLAQVALHEIFRTQLVIPSGMLNALQVVHAEAALHWDGEADNRAGDSPEANLSCDVRSDDASTHVVLRCAATLADAASLRMVLQAAVSSVVGGANSGNLEPLQYADFAGWQAEKAAEAGAEQLAAAAHWRAQQFASVSIEGDSVTIDYALSDEEHNAISAMRGASEAPSEAAWLALSVALMQRLTGTNDVETTVAIDGRQDDELIGAVGAYNMALPVRFADVADQTISLLIAEATASRQQAVAHSLLPPAVATNAALHFAHHTLDGQQLAAGEVLSLRDTSVAARVAIEVNESVASTSVRVTATDTHAQHTAAGFVRHLRGLLGAFTKPDGRDAGALTVREISIWLPADADAALRRAVSEPEFANATGPSSLAHCVAVHARTSPDAVAVVAGDGTLTYGELWANAQGTARAILSAQPVAAAPVGILLDRSVHIAASIIGCWLANVAYVPLHLDHPTDRFAVQLGTAGANVVVTSSALAPKLPAGITSVIIEDIGEDDRAGAIDPSCAGSSLAYVIFTSGSTGVPKGVAVTHANLMHYATAAHQRLLNGDAAARSFAMVTSFTTDLGNTSLALAMLTGGTLQIVPSEIAVDAIAYAQWNIQHPASLLKVTPSHLRALLAGGAGILPSDLLVVGGEALPWDLVRTVESLSQCRISNHYGPTETTIGALTSPIERDARHSQSATVPIGTALPGYRAYVVASDGTLTPDGVPGELCLGGVGVAQGYLGRDDFTAERFVADPLGGRMYRTGDSVRRHIDGSIEFLGRIDGQLKIRGYRVEPGEIEAALEQNPNVSQAAVVPNVEPSGDLRLVAYLTGSVAAGGGVEGVRATLAQTLPSHMIPSLIFVLESMPLTPNGKLDRSALPDPASIRNNDDDDYVAPRDEVERSVCEIWSELLGVERVGIEDDFFALGGHSLLAAQVIARILRDFGVHLPLHTLFIASNVEALAAMIAEEQIKAAGGEEAIAAMLDELEGLTDEEVAALLADDTAG